MPEPRALVLASTSRYRQELLARLGLAFRCEDPAVIESAIAGETPAATAGRLAGAKAHAVAARFPHSLVIGADQVASCGDLRMGKPGTHEKAVAQLAAMSGCAVRFDTAVALLDARSGTMRSRAVPTIVTFRSLSDAQIEDYLVREQPYDCAGSAKIEHLGIALVERVESDDPTALIGLPLIALTEMLVQAGVHVLAP
ncbi:MAG: Maf family nucleotide pyrophosphatase [Burkholderiales bacterium]